MKVKINETIDISDEQRLMIGAVLSGKQKPKYNATRDEIKEFVWAHGEGWATALNEAFNEAFAEPEEDLLGTAEEEDLLGTAEEEDLLGTADEDDDDDLI